MLHLPRFKRRSRGPVQADHPNADAHIARCTQRHPTRPMLPCSAASEVALLAARSQGLCTYELGASELSGWAADSVGGGWRETGLQRAKSMLQRYGSTGCLGVVSAAAALR